MMGIGALSLQSRARYKPGRANTNPDALSRNPVEIPGPNKEQFVTVALVSDQGVPTRCDPGRLAVSTSRAPL